MEFQCRLSRHLLGRLPLSSLLLPTVGIALFFLLTGCSYRHSKLHATSVPPGSLRLAQVMYIPPRAEIVAEKLAVQYLQTSGISESEIHDGTITVGRVECCGGPNERETASYFFVPEDIKVEIGDVVEIRSGSPGHEKNPTGPVNMLVRIREKSSDQNSQCRWDPPETYLWRRILYCDWMPAEGWTLERDGIDRYWVKLSR